MTHPLDGYPEIEKPYRADGSTEARQKCLEPVLENLEKIIETTHLICYLKNLQVIDLYLFQSRALGTCKPTSDIDIYVRLDPKHKQLIMDHGVHYKDTGIKLICGEWAREYFNNIPSELIETLRKMRTDLFLGVEPEPPAKSEYRNKHYYIKLSSLVNPE